MHSGNVVDPSWWGLIFIAAGLGLHLAGAHFYLDWANSIAILPVLAGLTLCLGGWRLLQWHWPAIAFLVFMLPLPYRLETSMAYPLQRLATLASTYVLQTLGFAAVAEGNTIIMAETQIGVVEACNGLGMMVTFFAMTTAVAILLRQSVLDKAIIVASAVPIALAANVARIALTGMLAEFAGPRAADMFFHDLAGWLMMPLALGMLWAEIAVLSRLFVETAPVRDPLESLSEFMTEKTGCLVTSN
jgi:exosortase